MIKDLLFDLKNCDPKDYSCLRVSENLGSPYLLHIPSWFLRILQVWPVDMPPVKPSIPPADIIQAGQGSMFQTFQPETRPKKM